MGPSWSAFPQHALPRGKGLLHPDRRRALPSKGKTWERRNRTRMGRSIVPMKTLLASTRTVYVLGVSQLIYPLDGCVGDAASG